MGVIDGRGDELRRRLNRAVDEERPAEVLALLGELERHEPGEPRWPHRRGDALKRAGRLDEAEAAYLRATERFAEQGFLPQAVALAKLVVALNPARSDLLDRIDQQATRDLRAHSARAAAAGRSASADDAVGPVAAPSTRQEDRGPSVLDGLVGARSESSARRLEPVDDPSGDEVRFVDVAEDESVAIDVADLDASLPPGVPIAPAGPYDLREPLDPLRLAQLSAAGLFADVSREALGELARAAELLELAAGSVVCRKGEAADALFVIVEGAARVELPWLPDGGVVLTAGQVLGEACLLRDAKRQADVHAVDPLTVLRIDEPALLGIVEAFPHVRQVLFDLLVKRVVTNTLQTSSLFSAFDAEQRKELARLFEVRLAPRRCVLQQAGKRSDGLYLLLVGDFAAVERQEEQRPLPLGTLVGHRSLLTRDVASRTVIAVAESLVLRLPASRFTSFATQYPPALAHLAETAAQPLVG